MNQHSVTPLTPAEEDPVIDKWLALLPEFVPGPHFEDAVMARVRVPAPSWVLAVQGATRALFVGKRAWMWAGGLAASSAVSIAAMVTLFVTHWVQVETAWSLLAGGIMIEAWRAAVALTVRAVSAGFAINAFGGLNYQAFVLAGLAGGLVTGFSLWGLYRMLRIDTERISLNASR